MFDSERTKLRIAWREFSCNRDAYDDFITMDFAGRLAAEFGGFVPPPGIGGLIGPSPMCRRAGHVPALYGVCADET